MPKHWRKTLNSRYDEQLSGKTFLGENKPQLALPANVEIPPCGREMDGSLRLRVGKQKQSSDTDDIPPAPIPARETWLPIFLPVGYVSH